MKYQRSGWFGNSQGHALAARGVRVRMYAARKQQVVLMDPIFYAHKQEQRVPYMVVVKCLQNGETYADLCNKYPEEDREELRERGIKALDMTNGSQVMSTMDKNGVDMCVNMAKHNERLKTQMKEALHNHQKCSFIPEVKATALKHRLETEA